MAQRVNRAGRVTLQFVNFFHNLIAQCFHWSTHWSLGFGPIFDVQLLLSWKFLKWWYLSRSFYFSFRLVWKLWKHHWPGVMLIWGRKDEGKFLIIKKYFELCKLGVFCLTLANAWTFDQVCWLNGIAVSSLLLQNMHMFSKTLIEVTVIEGTFEWRRGGEPGVFVASPLFETQSLFDWGFWKEWF